MDIHTLTPEAALRSLLTGESGLSPGDAAARLSEYGPNSIRVARKTPLYVRFLSQFTHFLALLLWVAAGLCVISDALHPGEGMLSLAAAITAVIVINAVFTFVQEYRAEKAVDALRRLLPYQVRVVRGGSGMVVRSEDVVPGDIVLLSEGDKVPADARLVESSGLMVNHAPLTGESEPLARDHAPYRGEYMDSPNLVFAGTLVVRGSGRAAVYASGMSTEFGRIAHLTGTVESGPSPLQREIVRTTRVIAVIAVITGISFFGLGVLVGRSFWHNFLFAIGIIIANVPEGLLPTVTLSLAMASQRMAKKNALIKDLTSVETLGSVTVICTDKTGTLTEGKMEAVKFWTPDGYAGSGTETPGSRAMMEAAVLCNNAVFAGGRYTGDPTESAVLKAALAAQETLAAMRLREIPFDSDRKRMTTINGMGGRTHVFMKGAPEAALGSCTSAIYGNGVLPLTPERIASITDAYNGMMGEGFRVIAFAYGELRAGADALNMDEREIESGLTFAGIMGLADPPRPEVAVAVAKCRGAGIRVVMVTGDASGTALAIGRQVGLTGDNARAVEGPELNRISDRELSGILSGGDVVFSRMTPRHKLRVVSVLKDYGERVAVTGDGVNDAPALKMADIGIAMGASGTDVAREAADMVLLDDNFASIVSAVEEGRAVFENIRKFMTYIFAHLTPEAVPYILFALASIPLPLTVMQILAIDLGTETIPALALGVDVPEEGVMKGSPRKRRSLVDAGVLVRGYLLLGLISAAGVLFAYFYVLYRSGWQWGMELPMDSTLARQATAATFLGIVIMQVGNVFACRSSRRPAFSIGLFSNRLVMTGVAVELVIAALIIYTPVGNRLSGSAPLSWDVWLVILPFAFLPLLADELRKYIAMRHPADVQ